MSYFTPEQMTSKITAETLPQIIMDLILASTNKIGKLKIPVSNLCGNFGVDGEVEIPENFANSMPIPSGKLVFEMGVNKKIKDKANEDYEKRKNQATKDTTYIFITSQIFSKADEWTEEKKQENDFSWKDLCCITQSELHGWFSRCPSVSKKWSEIWEFPTNELYTIESVWKRWDIAFEHKIPHQLVCALGYQRKDTIVNKKLLVDFVNGESKKFIITASSVEEARLYIASILFAEKEIQRKELIGKSTIGENTLKGEDLIDKVICLDSKAAFQKLPLKQFDRNIIVTPLQDADVINIAIANNIKIIQVLRATNTRETVNIALPIRIQKDSFHDVLRSKDFSSEKTTELARNSGRNLTTLRSILANEPQDWIKDISHELLVALLVGGWSSEYEDDIEVVRKLSGHSTYGGFTQKLRQYLNKENSPIQHEEPYYRAISAFSSFPALIEHITPEFLNEYKDICLKTLIKRDNIKVLPEGEQLLAQFKGETNEFSSLLRKSMADSLIHLSMLYKDGTSIADTIVREVCTASIERWKSIAPFILELAEASPRIFLGKLDELIKNKNKEDLQSLVNPNMGTLEGFGAYTSIIFALELLTWEERHLEKVANILFRFIPIWENIPSNVANTPLITLSEIFCIWLPQTNASLEKRNAILRQIVKKYPSESSNLLMKLLPPHGAIVSLGAKAKWRWKDDSNNEERKDVSIEDYRNALDCVFELSFDCISSSTDLLMKLIHTALENYLSHKQQEKLLDKMKNIQLIKEDSLILWNKLRTIIAQRKKYNNPRTNLFMLAQLEVIYTSYTPTDLYDKYIHYFYAYEHCLEITDSLEWSKDIDTRIVDKQTEAVHKIYTEAGCDGLLKLLVNLSCTENSMHFSFLSHAINIILKPVLLLGDKSIENFISNAVSSDIKHSYKLEILKVYINKFQENSLTTTYDFAKNLEEEFFINYLLALPTSEEVLAKLEKENELIQGKYWQQVDSRTLNTLISKDTVVRNLIKFKNFIGATSLVAYDYKDITDFSLISNILEGMRNDTHVQSVRNAIEILFARIETNSKNEYTKILQLEWQYYPLLKNKAHRLYKGMVQDSNYFLFFITLCFKSTKTEESILDPQVVKQAYDLIQATSLNNAPLLQAFRDESGILSFKQLDNWFSSLKEKSDEHGYEEIALSIAGAHLAYSGKVDGFEYLAREKIIGRTNETNDIFPEAPIRELLNKEAYVELRNAYKIAFLNRHGTWSGSAVTHYQNLKNKLEENLEKIEPSHNILCDMFNELIIRIDDRISWGKKQEQHNDMGV